MRFVILSLLILLLAACQPVQPFAESVAPTPTGTPAIWQVTLLMPNGQTLVASSAPTVGDVLRDAGLNWDEQDFIWPPPQTPLQADLVVEYRPAAALIVRVDGQEIRTQATGETVGAALASAGIALVGLDYSLPAESDPLPPDGVVDVVRVRETISFTQRSIPFQTQYVDSAEIPLGVEEILVPGKPGVLLTRTRIRYENGQETLRLEEAEAVVQPPQDRLSGLGTKITLQAVPGREDLQFWRAISMYATSYSPCRLGIPGRCNTGTAGGLTLRQGVVGMTRLWFNQLQGTQVYVPGYGVGVVGDIGGGFPDGRPWIDLGYSDDDFQTWSGWVTVYFLAPAPNVVPYFLK